MALSWFLLQIPVKSSSLSSEDSGALQSEQSTLQRRAHVTFSCLCSDRGQESEAFVCWWQARTGLLADPLSAATATREAFPKQACRQQPFHAPVCSILGLSTSRSGVTWNRQSESLGKHTQSVTFCQCNKCPPWISPANALTCWEIRYLPFPIFLPVASA